MRSLGRRPQLWALLPERWLPDFMLQDHNLQLLAPVCCLSIVLGAGASQQVPYDDCTWTASAFLC